MQPELRGTFNKLALKYPSEIDATILTKILKQFSSKLAAVNAGHFDTDLMAVRYPALSHHHHHHHYHQSSSSPTSGCCNSGTLLGSDKAPSLELCKSLIMLRDFNISGKINLIDVPALLQTLHFWRVNKKKFDFFHRSWPMNHAQYDDPNGRASMVATGEKKTFSNFLCFRWRLQNMTDRTAAKRAVTI